MLDALEKDLSIDIKEKSKKRIVDTFRLAKSLQLPVLEHKKAIGILDLYVFLDNSSGAFNIADIMEKDIVVAGEEHSVFSFKRSKQMILPFVDENGNYIGFINKVYHKCYLPSKEYLQVIEKNLAGVTEDPWDVDYSQLADSFNAIFESNYDGIYVTVNKGKTLSINQKAIHAGSLTQDDLIGDGTGGIISISESVQNNDVVTLSQIIQNRREISISDELFQDGGIIRIIDHIGNIEDVKKIKGFEKIKSELAETQRLKEKYQSELEFLRWEQTKSEKIVANSPEMKRIINLALRVAKVDSTVLIQGPSGTGKGVISNLIHSTSDRKNGPFIKIDCSSIPESLLESELFGYEQGAFTGAEKGGKPGLVELANNGTLFLDEIGEFPITLQAKLLRLLQDREIIKVGGKEPIPLDIRVIAATNRDLAEMVNQKNFRKDLYYRLNVVPIHIPPLENRKEDIRPLVVHFLKFFNKKYSLERKLDQAALKCLLDYPWPGNVRELENQIEYLVVTSNSDVITQNDVPESILKYQLPEDKAEHFFSTDSSMKEIIDNVEKSLLIEAMRKSKSTDEMAKLLKVDRSTVIRKLQKHGLKSHFN